MTRGSVHTWTLSVKESGKRPIKRTYSNQEFRQLLKNKPETIKIFNVSPEMIKLCEDTTSDNVKNLPSYDDYRPRAKDVGLTEEFDPYCSDLWD